MDACLIKNAALMDTAGKMLLHRDILIENGVISEISENIICTDAKILDVQGRYVSAGWIDAHAHLYSEMNGAIGVDQDIMIAQGITFAMDAGTAGPRNFETLLASCESKVLPSKYYLNLAPMGVDSRYGELKVLDQVDLQACRDVIRRFEDRILGVKLRIDPRVCEDPHRAMHMIRELADDVKKPLIVHASRTDMPMEDVLAWLKKGDIFAHTYADKTPGLLDEHGIVKAAAWEAKARGVHFDVSHGKANFSFKVAKSAIEQGFLPDAISTDLHKGSMEIVQSLSMTMSKMMACGLDLWTTIDLVTEKAARMLGLQEYCGEIKTGNRGNLTVFDVRAGEYTFTDSDGKRMIGSKRITPYAVCLDGKVYPTRSFS